MGYETLDDVYSLSPTVQGIRLMDSARKLLHRAGGLTLHDRRKQEMDMRHLLAGIAFVVLVLFSTVGTNLFFSAALGADVGGGDALRQVGILGACALLVIAQVEYRGTRPPMAMPVSCWIILAYCALSITWSIAPVISARRLALAGISIWIIVRAAGDLGAVRTLNILRWTLVVLLAADYVAVFTTPLGVHGSTLGDTETTAGDWRGVFGHKNAAGAVVGVTILLFLFDRRSIPWIIASPIILLAGVFLLETHSKTSMLVLIPSILVGICAMFYNPRQRFVISGLLLAAISTCVAALLLSPAMARVLNDPQAFTGRSRIWSVLLRYAQENPWLGTGFGAFWQIGPASPVYRLDNGWVAKFASHGHNGYLDLIVTIGIPGMVLGVAMLLLWPTFKLLSAWQISAQRRAILAAFIFYAAAHNLSESTLLGGTPVQIMLMIAVVLTHHLADQSDGRHQELRGALAKRWRESLPGRHRMIA